MWIIFKDCDVYNDSKFGGMTFFATILHYYSLINYRTIMFTPFSIICHKS